MQVMTVALSLFTPCLRHCMFCSIFTLLGALQVPTSFLVFFVQSAENNATCFPQRIDKILFSVPEFCCSPLHAWSACLPCWCSSLKEIITFHSLFYEAIHLCKTFSSLLLFASSNGVTLPQYIY